jgi:toxin YoeB
MRAPLDISTEKDVKKLTAAGLRSKAEQLFDILRKNPNQNPPPYEKPVDDLAGALSREINIQHRTVYQVLEERKVVKVIRMWTHCE